jgi:hypothetical protein
VSITPATGFFSALADRQIDRYGGDSSLEGAAMAAEPATPQPVQEAAGD